MQSRQDESARVKPGRYRHYKGNDYTVLGVARHSETNELLVVYRPEYGERQLWVRPQTMFEEQVIIDGQLVPRFALVEEYENMFTENRERR